ncbi:hypothetical protein J1N35_005753 [Gossypium stocksii]|uniref:Uncharacterized protein n=1 Tax=Gossypium stocksii TaxID=47602 RepID=A0A9D3WF23_9ROSI|nr:hypothetical protein J1N35_005753 [Gossypium stocksii]
MTAAPFVMVQPRQSSTFSGTALLARNNGAMLTSLALPIPYPTSLGMNGSKQTLKMSIFINTTTFPNT